MEEETAIAAALLIESDEEEADTDVTSVETEPKLVTESMKLVE